MKLALRSAWRGTGLSVFFLLPYIYPLIYPGHGFIYHLNASAALFFVPVLIDIALCGAIFGALLVVADRQRSRIGMALLAGPMLCVLPLLARTICLERGVPQPAWGKAAQILLVAVVSASVVFLVRPGSRREQQVRRFFLTVMDFAGVSGAIVVLELLFFFFAARHADRMPPLHSTLENRVASAQKARVVWIVLDELSYQQVYERRFPGLQLPAFDALASEATVFTHVVPAGDRTERVLPSLISGIHADGIRSSADGLHLSLHEAGTGRWRPFNPVDTVFGDALEAGYSTGAFGWYVPYCRILAGVLDHCVWRWSQFNLFGMTATASLPANVMDPVSSQARKLPGLLFPSMKNQVDPLSEVENRADYEALSAAADEALKDRSETMLLIHLPAPHPGAFYDRRTGSFITHGGSYLDGLALADKYLGHVRQLLKQQGEWDSDTVLIMGDHSWRTKLIWRSTAASWTREDEAASLGGFDDRPGYILKLPGQTHGALVDRPMAAIRTRALMDALFSKQIVSAADLSAWVDAGSSVAVARAH